MEFEQNIFIFHRAITKLPNRIFRIGIFIVVIFLFYETYIAFDNYHSFPIIKTDLEAVLVKLYEQNNEQYKNNRQFLKKYQQKQQQKQKQKTLSEKQASNQNPKDDVKSQQSQDQIQVITNFYQKQTNFGEQNEKPQKLDGTKKEDNQQNKKQTNQQSKIHKNVQGKTLQQHFSGLRKLFPQNSYLKIQIIKDSQDIPSYQIRKLPLNSPNQASDEEQNFQSYSQLFMGVYIAGIYKIPKNQIFQSHGMRQFVLKIKLESPTYLFANEEIVRNEQIFKILSSATINAQKIIKQNIGLQIVQIYKQAAQDLSVIAYFENFAIDRFILYQPYKNTAIKLKVPFQQPGLIWQKPLFVLLAFGNYIIIDVFMAIFVRYGIAAILTIYMILGGSGKFRWYQQYHNILNQRQNSCMLKFWLAFGITCTYGLISYGCWWVCSIIYQQVIQIMVDAEYYSMQFIKIIFFAELSHFLFMHTRTAIYFYSSLSFMLGSTVLFSIIWDRALHSEYLLTTYILLQIILVLSMLLVQKSILQQPFHSDYKPTLAKPRMLFFLGYDLTWEKGIPPLWTSLIKWFDWSYVKEKQGVYIDRDYRLLYGMLLGMNQRQPLPQDQQNEEQPIAPSMNNQCELSESREISAER